MSEGIGDLYIKRPNGRYMAIGGSLLLRVTQHNGGGFDVSVTGDLSNVDLRALAELVMLSLTREQEWFKEFTQWKAETAGRITNE